MTARGHGWGRLGAASVLVMAALVPVGCAGVFAWDSSSDCPGWHANGTVRHPSSLAQSGDGYVIPPPWRERQSHFGSDELVDMVVRASRSVAHAHPGAVVAVGDLSRRNGGGSAEHRSHQSGRDVDLFFYAQNPAGRMEPPHDVMIHFDRGGRAVRWSPAQGTRSPAGPVPAYRFDLVRNWRMVRALLRDPEVEVQWIFVQRDLAARLLEQGVAEGEEPALLARASQILRQPSDSEPHDDHMHVRIYCDPADRSMGCVDRGPVRWWKKRWKYMAAPFDRAAGYDAGGALLQMLRTREPALQAEVRLSS